MVFNVNLKQKIGCQNDSLFFIQWFHESFLRNASKF